MNITEIVRQVVNGDQRIYTLNDCFELLTEIRDELRKLNDRTESMPQGMPATPQPRPAAAIEARLDPRYLENRSSILSDPRLSESMAQYLEQKKHEVSPNHHDVVRLTLAGFLHWLPENVSCVTQVTKQLVNGYLQHVLDAGRTIKTANNHVSVIGAFFSWAVQLGLTAENPAAGLKLKDRTKASRKRKAFTPEQIREVFAELTPDTAGTPSAAKVWLPLIMLYTGARPEEVAQLRVEDVRQIRAGHNSELVLNTTQWVFDFATMDDGQRRKNEASRRLVPVHPRLWELGLGGMIEATHGERISGDSGCWTRDGKAQLFPELNPGANGRLAEAPSRWFNQVWLRQVKGISDRKLVLYSLRHSVATHLKYKGVEDSLIAQLLGHANSSMTTGRYGKEYPVEHLSAAVNLLDWCV